MVTHQPLSRTISMFGVCNYARHAISSWIISINGLNSQVSRINGEQSITKRQCDAGGGHTRNRESAMSVRLGTFDGRMDLLRVFGRSENDSRSGVEDGRPGFKVHVDAVHTEGTYVCFPKSFLRDVVERNERIAIEMCIVQSAKSDLSIIFLIRGA